MSNEAANELEEILEGLGALAAFNTFRFVLGIVAYVLGAIALYSLAKRRGIQHAWLSWIPIGNLWILGSLSDQYRYVSRREVKNKRKALLTMSLIMAVMILITAGLSVGLVVQIFQAAVGNYSEEEIVRSVVGPAMGTIFMGLPIFCLSIALVIVRFMALYDVFQSCSPDYAVMFLVLSIFIHVLEPFFLFFNRKKDTGMVRKQEPGPYQAPSYMDTPENGGTWSEPQQSGETVQNPEGSPEPWTQKPESQDPWNRGPEQL